MYRYQNIYRTPSRDVRCRAHSLKNREMFRICNYSGKSFSLNTFTLPGIQTL